MRQILLIAAVVMVGGGYMARIADKQISAPSAPQAAPAQPVAQAPATAGAYGPSLTLAANRQGHFQTDARVNGRRMAFMIDTGASLVVLRASAAAQAGIRPIPADYTASVSTANGDIKAAPARLDRIEIGDITVYDVSALVLPDEALSQNLLGVSFLSRLKRYQVADGKMVLEQ